MKIMRLNMKHPPRLSIGIIMALLCLCGNVLVTKSMEPNDLRCEFLVNPQGIDALSPRLSWISESDQRGQKQIAYHLIVASSREELDKNVGNLWDTEKVTSDQSIQIKYAGKAQESRMQCCWKVRVWDGMAGCLLGARQQFGRWVC